MIFDPEKAGLSLIKIISIQMVVLGVLTFFIINL
jgi:hypothetical protein